MFAPVVVPIVLVLLFADVVAQPDESRATTLARMISTTLNGAAIGLLAAAGLFGWSAWMRRKHLKELAPVR